MKEISKDLSMARTIAEKVSQAGGRVYFVGGYVRDRLMGLENKDLDMEIHGLRPEQLEKILDSLGQRLCIGESFGIYNLKGYSLDMALPRKEKLRGLGHRDFDIITDPFIGTKKAALRRDFTINAIMEDVLTGEIIDHYGGRADLEAKILRHVSDESFPEDPLRVLRGAQFAARFALKIAPETLELCRSMSLSELPRERIEAELKKALLKAPKPSVFFESLREMDRLGEWFGETQALIGVQQNPKYHGEGDVWRHSMLVLDNAVPFREQVQRPFGFMLAALCHDFGKAVCTEFIKGELHCYGHETAGLPLIRSFLSRITGENKLIDYVLNLCEYHMKPNSMAYANSSVKATNRLFDDSLDPEALICLSIADGMSCLHEGEYRSNEPFLRERLALYREYMARPYVTGRDLISAGLEPGEDFGRILDYAHKLRLAGIERESALKQSLAYGRKLRKTAKSS